MDAVADLKVDVAGRAFGVNGLVGVELGGDGGEDALPAGLGIHRGSLGNGEAVRLRWIHKYINNISKFRKQDFRDDRGRERYRDMTDEIRAVAKLRSDKLDRSHASIFAGHFRRQERRQEQQTYNEVGPVGIKARLRVAAV